MKSTKRAKGEAGLLDEYDFSKGVRGKYVFPLDHRRHLTMEEFRSRIILDYAKWTALSALRSGAPIKSRTDVYNHRSAVPG